MWHIQNKIVTVVEPVRSPSWSRSPLKTNSLNSLSKCQNYDAKPKAQNEKLLLQWFLRFNVSLCAFKSCSFCQGRVWIQLVTQIPTKVKETLSWAVFRPPVCVYIIYIHVSLDDALTFKQHFIVVTKLKCKSNIWLNSWNSLYYSAFSWLNQKYKSINNKMYFKLHYTTKWPLWVFSYECYYFRYVVLIWTIWYTFKSMVKQCIIFSKAHHMFYILISNCQISVVE